MKFINRESELAQLQRLAQAPDGGLAVVWGRRRIGKTRLLLEWSQRTKGLYLVADESAPPIQRRYFAERLAERFTGFNDVHYPDWRSLLVRLAREAAHAKWRGPFIIDELPYLVAAAPELPSVLQNWLDHEAKTARLCVALAGSCQRMMQGLVLDRAAPLYGRASVALQVPPLAAAHLPAAFALSSAAEAIGTYAVWGGVPRYWELAGPYGHDQLAAVAELLLRPQGALHRELDTLLLEELPPAISLRPILDSIGLGANRPSEIAARLGQPATSLSKPLARLQELGLVCREVPFGEPEKGTKRALYKLADPFTRTWFAVVAPHRAALTVATPAVRHRIWAAARSGICGAAWEELCRASVPGLHVPGIRDRGPWLPAARYWHGNGPEWDVVATNVTRDTLLLGEAKWSDGPCSADQLSRIFAELQRKGVPPVAGRKAKVRYAVFVPQLARGVTVPAQCLVVVAEDVLAGLAAPG